MRRSKKKRRRRETTTLSVDTQINTELKIFVLNNIQFGSNQSTTYIWNFPKNYVYPSYVCVFLQCQAQLNTKDLDAFIGTDSNKYEMNRNLWILFSFLWWFDADLNWNIVKQCQSHFVNTDHCSCYRCYER